MINILKQIFFDLTLLYKNFLHWNISKILISIFSFLLWALLSLPFFALSIWLAYFDPIDWKDIIYSFYTIKSFWLSFMTALSSHLFYVIIEWFLIILAIGFFMFGYSYKIITITKLYFSYLKWEKLSFMKNIYFNIKKILSYLSVISWIALILSLPFLFFIIVFFILLFSFWWIEEVSNMLANYWVTNMFSITAWIFFFICILVFLYLAYRLTFACIVILDENYDETQKWIFYIKESFKITSWIKIFKFLLVILIFSIIMIPFDYIWKIVEDMSFLNFLYRIFIFLLLWWVFEMLIVSIYKNIMVGSIKKEEIV